MALDLTTHPCFNKDIKHKFGRIHLPVAPKCNIQCNFCNRKYDCVNESRPGVTSNILSPHQALAYLDKMMQQDKRIKVVGIAGPGDPFANPQETMETLRLVRQAYPEMLLCVATNGLNADPYVQELVDLNVTHLTVTCCAVDPDVSSAVYAWVRHDKRVFRNREAGQLMIDKQLATIKACKKLGLTVKVNCIVIPGINDHHIEEVAKVMKELEVDLLNCMGLCHVPDTPFETIVPPSTDELKELRACMEQYVPQMHHCTRCRADAVGCLGEGINEFAMKLLRDTAAGPLDGTSNRPNVAVASLEGMLVNQHLGEAKNLWIFGPKADGDGYELLEQRRTPQSGSGDDRWVGLGDTLKDCRALLVGEAGQKPRDLLAKTGVKVYRTEGAIQFALEAVYQGKHIKTITGPTRCGVGCTGTGNGCG